MKIINGVEVWKAGTANDGRIITPEDVQQVYDGTVKVMADGYNPIIKDGGHWQPGEEIPGTVVACEKIGDSIYCDISVSDELYDSLESKKLPYRSVEITKEFVLSTKEKIPQFLSAIAFLGASIPAIHSLKPIFGSAIGSAYEFYHSELSIDVYKTKYGGPQMEFKEMFERADKENTTLKKQVEEYTSKVGTLETENKTLKTESEKKDAQIKLFEANQTKMFFDSLINTGVDGKRLIPAKREAAEKVFSSLIGTMGREEAEKQIQDIFLVEVDLHRDEFSRQDEKPDTSTFSMADHSANK